MHRQKDANTGSATIVTAAGGDPFFYSSKLAANLLPKATKLMFEYQASTSVQDAKIYFVDYAGETRSISLGNLNASTKWTQKTVDIAELCRIHGWGFEGDYMRFDPGTKSGLTFKIRNICINTGEYTSTLNLQLDNYNSHDNSLSRDAECNPSESDILYGQNLAYSSWTINTTGSDPYIVSNPLDKTSMPMLPSCTLNTKPRQTSRLLSLTLCTPRPIHVPRLITTKCRPLRNGHR